ncbi:MAG: hypothetical protein EZS28_036755, partial [Streblomastix strix]
NVQNANVGSENSKLIHIEISGQEEQGGDKLSDVEKNDFQTPQALKSESNVEKANSSSNTRTNSSSSSNRLRQSSQTSSKSYLKKETYFSKQKKSTSSSKQYISGDHLNADQNQDVEIEID